MDFHGRFNRLNKKENVILPEDIILVHKTISTCEGMAAFRMLINYMLKK